MSFTEQCTRLISFVQSDRSIEATKYSRATQSTSCVYRMYNPEIYTSDGKRNVHYAKRAGKRESYMTKIYCSLTIAS